MKATERDLIQIAHLHKKMGISESYADTRLLIAFSEAPELVKVDNDIDPRCFYLAPDAKIALHNMQKAAHDQQVDLQVYSGFRSYEYQKRLIEDRVNGGESLESVLAFLAAPGFSEHHTGLAIDLTTSGCSAGCEEFEKTEAFKWLEANAINFNFRMSYPRNNPWGFVYEPWHWAYQS